VVWAEEGRPTKLRYITYARLRQQICAVAASLQHLGFQRGEAIAICMPMTAESISIYLGIIWSGCCVVGIADSFSKVWTFLLYEFAFVSGNPNCMHITCITAEL